MAQGEVARLSVGFTADTTSLDRSIRQGEEKARKAGQNLEKALSVGKLIAAVTLLANVGKAAITALDAGMLAFEGKTTRAADAVLKLAEEIERVPLVGQAFGLGGAIGERIFGDKKAATEIEENQKRVEREQQRRTRDQMQFQKTEQALKDEIQLLKAPERDRDCIRLEQGRDASLREAQKLLPSLREQLIPQIQERFQLQLQGLKKTAGPIGEQISARTVFGDSNLTPVAEKPVTRAQGEKQISLLVEMVRFMRQNPGVNFTN